MNISEKSKPYVWENRVPEQDEDHTIEGFPIGAQKLLRVSRVFRGTGLKGGVLVPENQTGVEPGWVRVIIVGKLSLTEKA